MNDSGSAAGGTDGQSGAGQPSAAGQQDAAEQPADAAEAPGAAAQREHERKRRERRARVLARHPRIGWLLLALAGAQAYEENPRGRAAKQARERDQGTASREPS